jgi:copper transport protein
VSAAAAAGLLAALVAGTALSAALAPAATAATTAPAATARPVHATLVTTSPADAAVVPAEPARVTAGFDQPVGVSADSLVVYTPGGQRADAGGTRHDGPFGIAVTLNPGLGQGTYTAEWHVVSADSHEVQGAFTFSVGAPSATHVPAIKSPDAATVATLYAVARWLEYAFFVLLAGVVAFLIICWPSGARRKGVPGLVVTGWAGLIGSTLAALLLQGPYSQNVGLGLLLNPALEVSTLHTRLGSTLQARQLLTICAAIAATAIIRRLPRLTARVRVIAGAGWAVIIAGIAATWATADHASTGFQVPLAITADIVHLVATAVWGGGLVMLAAFTLRGPSSRTAALAVRRFSPIALGCVAALAVSGGYMAWRLIGTWGALFGTTYGLLVIAKSAGFAILVCLGYLARRFIHRRLLRIDDVAEVDDQAADAPPAVVPAHPAQAEPTVQAESTVQAAASGELALATVIAGHTAASRAGRPGSGSHQPGSAAPDNDRPGGGEPGGHLPPGGGQPDDAARDPRVPSMRDLRLSVTAEVGVVALVLAATAILVSTATGRESYAPPVNAVEQFDTGAPNGAGTVDVIVTPARLGGNQVTMTFDTPAGRAFVPAQVQAALVLPARNLGPLPVALTPAGPGRYRASAATFTFTGQWQLLVTVRSDDFDETTVVVKVNVHQ